MATPTYSVIDPIAQSFFIDKPCVVTKMDLFFKSKDNFIPVTVQFRKNQLGVPGPYIIPLSTKLLSPSSVLVSSNANVATTVNFTSPIFLDTGEYSITLGTTSKKYSVWISELNSTDIISGKNITEQPYIGNLFKGQNITSYTPVLTQDLKFILYRASYNTSVVGFIDFKVPGYHNTTKLLENDPLELFPNSSIMRIHHKDHPFTNQSYVRLLGIANAFPFGNVLSPTIFGGITSTSIEGRHFVVSNVRSDSYTVNLSESSTVTSAFRFGGPAIVVDSDLRFDTIYPKIPHIKQSGNISSSFKAASPSYTLDSSFKTLADDDNELDYTRIIASNVNTTFRLSNATPFVYRINFSSNNTLTSPLIDKSQIAVVLVNNKINSPNIITENLRYDRANVAVLSKANIYVLNGNVALISYASANVSEINNAKSILNGTDLVITGLNPNNGQYRVLEVLNGGANIKVLKLANSISVVTDANIQNNHTIVNASQFVYEEAATGGSAISKYITKKIDFVNPSTSINIRADVSQPTDTEVLFYFKTKLIGEAESFDVKEFTQVENVTIAPSLDGKFIEVEKQIDALEPFDSLIIKIVFKSSLTYKVPKVKNLRVIALE